MTPRKEPLAGPRRKPSRAVLTKKGPAPWKVSENFFFDKGTPRIGVQDRLLLRAGKTPPGVLPHPDIKVSRGDEGLVSSGEQEPCGGIYRKCMNGGSQKGEWSRIKKSGSSSVSALSHWQGPLWSERGGLSGRGQASVRDAAVGEGVYSVDVPGARKGRPAHPLQAGFRRKKDSRAKVGKNWFVSEN